MSLSSKEAVRGVLEIGLLLIQETCCMRLGRSITAKSDERQENFKYMANTLLPKALV